MMMMDSIFCEQSKCQISATGCVARQKRAGFGVGWTRGHGPGNNGGRQIPFDPVCKDCEQGKEVMGMIEGQKGGTLNLDDDGFPLKADWIKDSPEPKATESITTEQEKLELTMPVISENTDIPYGYCHCGCGEKTRISHTTDRAHGYVKGEPRSYVQGHHFKTQKNGKPVSKKKKTELKNKVAEKTKEQKTESGKKFDAGKLRFDLLPPDSLKEIVKVFTSGAEKYGEHNWSNGMSWSRVFGAAQRHQWAFWGGEDFDSETTHNHIAHAIVNLMFLLAYYERRLESLDDRGQIQKIDKGGRDG